MESKKKPIFVICLDSILVTGAFLLRIFLADIMKILPECTYAARGRQCGSCGGTRCIYQLLHGNISEAFRLNQLFFIAFCYLGIIFILLHLSWLFKFKFADKPLKIMANYKVAIVFAVSYFFFSIWRFYF